MISNPQFAGANAAQGALSKLDRLAVIISAAVPVQATLSAVGDRAPMAIPAIDFEDRWVQIPSEGRDEAEIAVSRRFPLHPSVAVSVKRPLPDAWIHRTVQRASGVTVIDEAVTEDILYTIYSTNVSILGARQTDQLITILLEEYDCARFTSTETDDELGTMRLRIFALIKATNPARNEDFYIEFSPVAAITAILTPANDESAGREDLLRVYNALDTARITVQKRVFPNAVTLLTQTFSERFLGSYHYLDSGLYSRFGNYTGRRTAYQTKVRGCETNTSLQVGHAGARWV